MHTNGTVVALSNGHTVTLSQEQVKVATMLGVSLSDFALELTRQEQPSQPTELGGLTETDHLVAAQLGLDPDKVAAHKLLLAVEGQGQVVEVEALGDCL